MLKQIIPCIIHEISAIEAKTFQVLKKQGLLIEDGFSIDREKRLWLSVLCLLSARIARGINVTTVQLAEMLHLLSYASHCHWSLPEESKIKEKKQEIQLPILIGDFLYSRMHMDICRYGLQQYLLPLSTLIGRIHEYLVLRDSSKQNPLLAKKHEINIYAIMSENACFLGAHSAIGSIYVTELLKEFGYHLGVLKGVIGTGEDIAGYYDSWYNCWYVLDKLLASEKESFEKILLQMGAVWELENPFMLKRGIV